MGHIRFRATAISVMCAGALVLGLGPAQAGLFDSSSSTTVSDGTIANIQRALDEQRYVDAGTMLDQVLLGSGNDPRLTLLVGQLGLARGHYSDALDNFKSIDSVARVRARALEGEGIALSMLGRSDEALPALQSAVIQEPTAWRAWNVLGTEYDRRHEWSKADDAYSHAMSASNGAAIVLNNRGFSRLSQQRLDEAVSDFVAALGKQPDLSAARNNLRLAMAMKGDYDRALSGSSASERAAILNNVGYAAMLRGDYVQARELLGQAMKARQDYYALAAANLQLTNDLAASNKGAPEGSNVLGH